MGTTKTYHYNTKKMDGDDDKLPGKKFWFERIGAAKANKATGLDELAIDTAKLSAPAANAWSEIAMLSFTDEDFGKLANGRYVLPWKRKKTQENRDSYRKLLILGHLYKLVGAGLSKWTEPLREAYLTESQWGFRAKRGTKEATLSKTSWR